MEVDGIGPDAIAELCATWESNVGQQVAVVTDAVHAMAVAMAPASPRGSKYAPPGFLKTRVAVAHKVDDGQIVGLVGVPLHAGSRYPLPFVDSSTGTARNANRIGGKVRHYGYRAAANHFLLRALNAVAG